MLVRGTSRDVIHSWWIPRLNGKRDMVPGRVQTLRLEADEPGIYAGQCTEFCGLSHANMRMEVVALDAGRLRDVEGQPARRRTTPPEEGTLAAEGERRSSPSARAATRSTGSTTPTATRSIAQPEHYVYSEAAPEPDQPDDPQHVRRRHVRPAHRGSAATEVWDAPPEEFGAAVPGGRHAGVPQRGRPARVAAQRAGEEADVHRPDELGPTDGKTRGMPYLALSEDQIDQLVAYLLERK